MRENLWLKSPAEKGTSLDDASMRVAMRTRLAIPVVQQGKRCRHVRADGTQCPVLHDKYAHHAACCESGGGLLRRHNALRDLLAKLLAQDLGTVVAIEQRVPQLNRVNKEG